MERAYYFKRLDLAVETSAPYGVGAFIEGNVLMVVEQSSDLVPVDQPFCSDDRCSVWFNSLIEKERIPEEKLFWVNALSPDGNYSDIKSIVMALKPSSVVAIGSVAKDSCTKSGVQFYSAYHPQYWKMFNRGAKYPLLNLLKFLTNV